MIGTVTEGRSTNHGLQTGDQPVPNPLLRDSSLARFVARLSDGAAPTSDERADPAAIVAWCRRNRYPLLALAAHIPDWLRRDAAFRAALDEEGASYDEQRREYLLVRDAWLARGIDCLMFKSAGNAPSFPHTSDNIDILVQPQDGRRARDILRERGYVELRNIEEPKKFLFRLFHNGASISAIHVHEQVGWLVGFMDEAALWLRRRPAGDDPAVTVPSPEDAVLINLAHACYENKVLRFNDVARVRHALRTAGDAFDWGYLEHVAAARGWRDGLAFIILTYAQVERELYGDSSLPEAIVARFEAIVRAHPYAWRRLAASRDRPSPELPLDLSYRFCKWLYYRKIYADPLRTRPQQAYDTLVTLLVGFKLKSGIRPQAGMTVTFSGPDGSGKTTHAQALIAALRLAGIKTTYVWNRGGSTGLLGLVSRLRRARAQDTTSTRESAVARRRRRLANPAVRLAWAWLVAADQVATYVARVIIPARLGRVVVADRYAYDTAAEMDATLPPDDRLSRLAIRAMLALTPRPHLPYLVTADPHVAQSRRSDEGLLTDACAERGRYRALAERYHLRAICNDGDFAAGNDPLIRDTVMHYMARFPTPLNGLLLGNPRQKNWPDPIWRKGSAE